MLSDVLPILENMGLRVVDERPYEIKPEDRRSTWIYDIGVVCGFDVDLRTEATRTAFQDAFTRVWSGEFENDQLGALVLRAGLTGREVALLRAVVKYLRQTGTTFSDRYLEQALTGNPAVARLLVELFGARLDPDHHDLAAADRLGAEIERAIDDIASLDQDRILRNCLAVVRATVRTNYFQRSPEGRPKSQLSLKLDPSLMPFLPFPRPRFEIFVYSPRVEGVHLRGGRVARGGIRWSDRREDFRTEVLGLMKAQMVKNAVIVPVGAKGGFVIKRPPPTGDREALLQQAADCYRLFVSGLLDLTDNIVGGKVVPPPAVVRHDEDDVYLVVAADKGTASLSDLGKRRRGRIRLLARRRVRLGRIAWLRPQEDGDHRSRGVGIGQAPFPPPRSGRRVRRLHRRRYRRHVGGCVRQRDAALAAHQARGGLQRHSCLPRSPPRSGGELRRAAPAL